VDEVEDEADEEVVAVVVEGVEEDTTKGKAVIKRKRASL
jgi:hypothetical protein